MIYIRIFQNKQKSLIDSGASISIISEPSVPKTHHIAKCNKSIKDLSGQLNILRQILIEIGYTFL